MSEAIAELLHSLMCDKKHNENECEWYLECESLDEWTENEHLNYLGMAEHEMKISGMTENDVINLMNAVTKIDFSKSLSRKILKRFIEISLS